MAPTNYFKHVVFKNNLLNSLGETFSVHQIRSRNFHNKSPSDVIILNISQISDEF